MDINTIDDLKAVLKEILQRQENIEKDIENIRLLAINTSQMVTQMWDTYYANQEMSPLEITERIVELEGKVEGLVKYTAEKKAPEVKAGKFKGV